MIIISILIIALLISGIAIVRLQQSNGVLRNLLSSKNQLMDHATMLDNECSISTDKLN